jgi:hypothetical protein
VVFLLLLRYWCFFFTEELVFFLKYGMAWHPSGVWKMLCQASIEEICVLLHDDDYKLRIISCVSRNSLKINISHILYPINYRKNSIKSLLVKIFPTTPKAHSNFFQNFQLWFNLI